MTHNWDTASDSEWRHFVAEHLEVMAHNESVLT
jgi:hypothetical protein